MTTKVARLMLVSDVLHNSSAHVPKASRYRGLLETNLAEICESLQVNPLLFQICGCETSSTEELAGLTDAQHLSTSKSGAGLISGMPTFGAYFCIEEG